MIPYRYIIILLTLLLLSRRVATVLSTLFAVFIFIYFIMFNQLMKMNQLSSEVTVNQEIISDFEQWEAIEMNQLIVKDD